MNLTGLSNPTLTLDHWSLGDESTALPATFTGSVDGDGIAISVDGTNWATVTNLTGDFTDMSFNLTSALDTAKSLAGTSDVSHVRIKFQQYDNFGAALDGREFDNIRIA